MKKTKRNRFTTGSIESNFLPLKCTLWFRVTQIERVWWWWCHTCFRIPAHGSMRFPFLPFQMREGLQIVYSSVSLVKISSPKMARIFQNPIPERSFKYVDPHWKSTFHQHAQHTRARRRHICPWHNARVYYRFPRKLIRWQVSPILDFHYFHPYIWDLFYIYQRADSIITQAVVAAQWQGYIIGNF